jgi:predicted signal transduction protein with EAL and GGDEF domain
MADAEYAITVLRSLKNLGVRLSIDDFGTGYSSLSYLKKFPVDILKIDRSFVDGLGVEDDDTAIVQATINLAHSLGLTTVAEGTETPEQVRALTSLGCDKAQGYLFSRPQPATALTETLLARAMEGWVVGSPAKLAGADGSAAGGQEHELLRVGPPGPRHEGGEPVPEPARYPRVPASRLLSLETGSDGPPSTARGWRQHL